jgi:DNA-binding beta-propeller fold protein YncE
VVVAVDDEEPRAVVIEVGTETVIASLPGILTAPIGGASVAPEGGCAFIAHARGIAAYDIESTPPKFLFNLTDNAYGACVAGLGGKVVFAINNQTHQVDRIDVDARAVARQIDTGRGPNDLAISDDSSTLFVTDLLENQIVMVTVANNQMGVPTPTGAPARTVTATGRAAPILAYFAHRGQATRWDGNAIQNFPMAAVDPADSDITTNGRRYYVVNRDPDTRVHELVIFNREDMKELARLPVGEQPHSVTIVPRRWRAYVSNSADGTVTVVDVDSLRDRLCRLAASCGVPEDPCVVLATLELLPDGSIGPPDLCTFRTRLYSNAMLLELILCLAERIEECCGGHALPPDNPPPPAIDSLKVMEVEMISYAQPNPIPLERPDEPINITLAFNRIRVVFNRPVDQASVTSTDENTASFLVQRQPRQGAASFVHGEIGFEDPQTVLYTVTERESFERGDYTVTLFGDETPPRLSIRDQATNTRLDGEPLALPSGNGIEGGNFVFKFRVRTRD